MRDNHLHNLLFLLGASTVAAAGCDININDGSDSGNSGMGTDGGDDGATDGADDGNDDGADDGNDDAVDEGNDDAVDEGTDDAVDEGNDTVGPADTGADDESGYADLGSGGYVNLCEVYGLAAELCVEGAMGPEPYTAYCEQVIGYYYESQGADCATAFAEVFVCLTTLDCKELVAGEGCVEETEALQEFCTLMPPR